MLIDSPAAQSSSHQWSGIRSRPSSGRQRSARERGQNHSERRGSRILDLGAWLQQQHLLTQQWVEDQIVEVRARTWAG